jgi:RimJ/RimL family protein N-acetyltransferase
MPTAEPSRESPILNLTGDKVALGPLRRDLLPLYQRWNNDFASIWLAGMKLQPQTLEAAEAWYDRLSQRENEVWFTLYERATLRPLGLTILLGIDRRHHTASFAIGIGEEEDRGKGYGTAATILTLDYGFTALGLHNIRLSVHACNERAIRAYTRAGFRPIGRRREAVRLGGQVYDSLQMDCLATEFDRPALRRLLEPASESEGETAP